MNLKTKPLFRLLHQPIDYYADVTPNNIAIDEGTRQLRYANFAKGMNTVAANLQKHGVQVGDRVGLLIDNSIDAFIGMFGILRAGACYVPLGVSYPIARIQEMIANAELKVVVSTSEHTAIFSQLGHTVVLISTALESASTGGSVVLSSPLSENLATLLPAQHIEEDLAYLIYTSGTTGKPKGAMLTHRNVNAFANWATRFFEFSQGDRFSNHARLTFDSSVFDIYCAFFSGATLCPLMTLGERSFPAKFIRNRKISVWNSVPSVIGIMKQSNQISPGCFSPHLRYAVFCGETLLPEQVQVLMQTNPDIALYNLYGPTEATYAVTHYAIPKDFDAKSATVVPIGRANHDTTEIILLGDDGKPVNAGEPGRLMICGTQLSPGYWKQPELNEERFLTNPLKKTLGAKMYDTGDYARRNSNGDLIWLGRSDDQIKLNGFRIELGEIEAVILASGKIDEVAVVLPKQPEPRLVAVICPTQGKLALAPEELEEFLFQYCESRLPAHMVPQQFTVMTTLPKNQNGKTDRKKLLELLPQ